MFDRHADALEQNNISSDNLRGASTAYRQLERFWAGLLNYNLRGSLPPL